MIFKIFLALAIPFLLSACAAAVIGGAGAGAASAVYVMGKAEADVDALPIQLAQATKQAFTVLAITPGEFHQTDLDAKITGYTANKDKITVTVKRKTGSVSHLSIRVGYFGDETFSQLIYDEIMRQLKAASAQSVVTTSSSSNTSVVVPSVTSANTNG